MRLQHGQCFLAIILASHCLAAAQEQPNTVDARRSPASPEQIAEWVKELDADQFGVRRTATDKLFLAGRSAIQPIEKALVDSNLEVSTRGIFVLRKLALCGDVPTEEAATEALGRVANNRSSSAARIANEALLALDDIRCQNAIKQLQQLGAIIIHDPIAFPFNRQPFFTIEIGKKWQGSDADLRRLKYFRNIHSATFEGPRISDRSIQPLRHVSGLRVLTIKHANVTDAAFQIVRNLQNLAEVHLLYTPVTDTCLKDLGQLRSLARLRIIGTRVSAGGAEQFQLAAPRVKVDFKKGAFLGVECAQPPLPCTVNNVTVGSAADVGGILRRDVIVKYDGKPVPDFDTLKKLIALNFVNDTVTIHVARRAPPTQLKFKHQVGQLLGVDGRTVPLGCEVTKVVEGSEAAAAGIRVGDIIVACAEVRVYELPQLNRIYAQRGDSPTITIEVLRDVKTV